MKENKVQNNCINNLEDMQPQLVVVVQGWRAFEIA